jgi:anti-sigma factor RsiW
VLELEAGTACLELHATDDAVQVLDVTASEPRRELAELLRAAADQPAAVRLLTGSPGPLPPGRVRRIGTLDKVLAFPGVASVVVGFAVGDVVETDDPEPHGYVLATGPTNLQAVERADAAARLVDIEVW